MKHVIKFLLIATTVFFALLTSGCSSGSNDASVPPSSGNQVDTPIISSQGTLALISSQSYILQTGSATMTATVLDSTGDPVDVGTTVTFTVNNSNYGTFSSSTATTNAQGVASVTFTGATLTGTATITATSSLGSSKSLSLTIQDAADTDIPASITLEQDRTGLLVGETAAITATLLDAGGSALGEGISVSFSLSGTIIGTISPATTITNRSGVATATFTAADVTGETTITARSMGTDSNSVTMTILGADAAVISFHDVSTNIISVKQSGGMEYTNIRYLVSDDVNRPVQGEPVSFRLLRGPGGGEYIDSTDSTPYTIDASTDSNGLATVTLHSGFVAGPVTIQATIEIEGTPVSINSSVVSIGGGVLSDERFDVAATLLNVPGLYILGFETEITAYLADRFGNYNILDGTTVSFSPETGLTAFSSGISQAENGLATVTLRTQNAPKNVAPLAWESALQADILARYGITFTGHPRDGVCSVLVYAKGEEHFTDLNGNGYFNDGVDLFNSSYDTQDDPFCDYNDNGTYDDGSGTDPGELYVDSSNDGVDQGVWNDKNGEWDADKAIFQNFPILITGEPIVLFESGFDIVGDGASRTIHVLVCDRNLNPLSIGTKVSIALNNSFSSVDYAAITNGITSFEFPNSNMIGFSADSQLGLIEFEIEISDINPDINADPGNLQQLSVVVDWEGMTKTYYKGFYVH